MRRQLVIMAICMLFVTLCIGGCDKLGTKPDQITVNIMVAVYVHTVDANNNTLEESVDGITVNIEIIKDGHDRLVSKRIVQNGLCQATGSFILSKGQFIECNATILGGYADFYPVAPGYSKLTWETVNASTNFGGVYNWYPKMNLNMKKG
jgi:hypothetical protein